MHLSHVWSQLNCKLALVADDHVRSWLASSGLESGFKKWWWPHLLYCLPTWRKRIKDWWSRVLVCHPSNIVTFVLHQQTRCLNTSVQLQIIPRRSWGWVSVPWPGHTYTYRKFSLRAVFHEYYLADFLFFHYFCKRKDMSFFFSGDSCVTSAVESCPPWLFLC